MPSVWPRSLLKVSDKLFLAKMGEDLESISMESQDHIFTFDLIWGEGGRRTMPRGDAIGEHYFLSCINFHSCIYFIHVFIFYSCI